jgi:hypothetical protein
MGSLDQTGSERVGQTWPHTLSRGILPQRVTVPIHNPQSTGATVTAASTGNGHATTAAPDVSITTPRFVRCGKFVFNLDHVASMRFGDDDVRPSNSATALA